MRFQPDSLLRQEAPLSSHPTFLELGGRGERGRGLAVANNSSGATHSTPGCPAREQLPERQGQPVRGLALPGSQAQPGPELCAKAREHTEPNAAVRSLFFS